MSAAPSLLTLEHFLEKPIPLGLCQCGCGEATVISPKNRRDKGWVSGQPRFYVHGHQAVKTEDEKWREFWSRVRWNPDGCWLWVGWHQPNGYANYPTGRLGERSAHCITYIYLRGPIPEGLELDHLRRNRGCINPWHLEPVTRKENTRRGVRSRSKLTAEQVIEIKHSSLSERKLAKLFGVTRTVISTAKYGSGWADVQ